MPIDIDGLPVGKGEVTIDGEQVKQITVDGERVWVYQKTWNSTQYDSQNTGSADVTGLSSNPSIKWRHDAEFVNTGSGAVDESTVYYASQDNNLYAVDRETGGQNWSLNLGTSVEGGVTLDGDYLYVAGGDGVLRKVDLTVPEVVWTYSTGNSSYYSPAYSSNENLVYIGDDAPSLHAVNADTGEGAWTVTNENVNYGNAPTPAISESGYIYACIRDNLYKIDSATGSTDSIYGASSGNPNRDSAVTLGGGNVYTTGDNGILAVGKESFDHKWNALSGENIQGSCAYHDGSVYVLTDTLHSFDAQTGDKQWTYDEVTGNFSVQGSPCVVDDTVYFPTRDAQSIIAVDTSGNTVWSIDVQTASEGVPAILDGTMYIAAGEEMVAIE